MKTSPPLIYRMASALSPSPKRGVEQAHRSIVNRLRRYSAASIVEHALTILHNPPAQKLDELQMMPWLTLLLVKWALQDNGVHLRVGPPIPAKDFNRLRQELWDLQDPGEERRPGNIWLMLRAIMNVQLQFQRAESWSFLRWPALYSRLQATTNNRRQFREVMGLEPSSFIDLTYAMYAAVLSGKIALPPDWLQRLRPHYGADVEQMYDLFVRDLAGLRKELRTDAAQKLAGRQELFEFPYLRRFPFLRQRDGQLMCWHPLVFARGMEDAIHLRLSALGKDYVDEFSRVFEQYVTELASSSNLPVLDEAAYKKQLGSHYPSVEAIIDGGDCNILVEAKMSLFADDVLIQDSETVIFQKTKRIRDGIKQGWKVGAVLRDPKSGLDPKYRVAEDFLLVVTSRELLIGGGEALQRLYPPGEFDYPHAEAKQHLPLSQVFILSVEEFERTMGSVAAGDVRLNDLLREAAKANGHGSTARMFFSDFLRAHTKRWRQPALMEQARREAHARIVGAFTGEGQKGA